MGIFDKMFGKAKKTRAELIMLSCVKVGDIILDKNQRSKGAIFEVLLFSSLHILKEFKQKKPDLYSRFETDYFEAVFNFARKEGILSHLPCDFSEFINNRFQLYDQQLKSIFDNPQGTFIPSKIVYNFYEQPLTKYGGVSCDLEAALIFTMQMKYLFVTLDGIVDLIFKEDDFTKQIKNNNNEAEVYYNNGDLKAALKDFDGAIVAFTKSIELDEKKVWAYWAYLGRGKVKQKIKDYLGAIADYSKSIEIDSTQISAYQNRGELRRDMKDYIGAISDYFKVLELDPDDSSDYYYEIGNCKLALADFKGAISCFNKSIEIEPKNVFAYWQRGIANSKLQNYTEAITDFTKSIELDIGDLNATYLAYLDRGNVKGILKDFAGAINDFTVVIDINPKNINAYYNRGLAKCRLYDLKGAIEDFDKVAEINPKYANAYYNRGLCKIHLGRKDSAFLDLSKAGELVETKAYKIITQYKL